MSRKPTVLLISTMDTKHQEAEFVMAGMVRYPAETPSDDKPLVLLSTLGTTETCIKIIRGQLLKAENSRAVRHSVTLRTWLSWIFQ